MTYEVNNIFNVEYNKNKDKVFDAVVFHSDVDIFDVVDVSDLSTLAM